MELQICPKCGNHSLESNRCLFTPCGYLHRQQCAFPPCKSIVCYPNLYCDTHRELANFVAWLLEKDHLKIGR